MNTFVSLYWSTVGRKFWTALTGICLVGFVIVHLVGNLTLFMGNQAMNDYAWFLETALHGGLRPFGELALLVLFGGGVVGPRPMQSAVRLAGAATRRFPVGPWR